MPKDITMPRLSDTMEVGTIVKWSVKPGQQVRSGDVIADIETDKATMELQTFDDGTVADLVVGEGQQVPVGTVIMRLAEKGEAVTAGGGGGSARSAAAASTQAESVKGPPAGTAAAVSGETRAQDARRSEPAPAPATGGGGGAGGANGHHGAPRERIFASPLARKIAGEHNLDLGAIEGSGPSGRIIRRDVEAAVASAPAGLAPTSRTQSASERAPASAPAPRPAPKPLITAGALSARTFPLSNMRATIARRLVQSKSAIPHYQVSFAIRMDALMSLRSQLNEQLASQGVKLSVNDFLVRACALAMHQHPYVNSRWIDAPAGKAGAVPSVEFLPDVNVGVAIALPIAEDGSGGGLVVATLRNADQKGLRQISAETRAMSDKARGKGLSLDEMSDSTFTISNLGMFGVEHFTAIINPPNTAILAVGAAVEKAVVETDPKTGEKRLVPGHEMQMTMSSDHRVIDGAMAAQYLSTVKQLLEKPATLLV